MCPEGVIALSKLPQALRTWDTMPQGDQLSCALYALDPEARRPSTMKMDNSAN